MDQNISHSNMFWLKSQVKQDIFLAVCLSERSPLSSNPPYPYPFHTPPFPYLYSLPIPTNLLHRHIPPYPPHHTSPLSSLSFPPQPLLSLLHPFLPPPCPIPPTTTQTTPYPSLPLPPPTLSLVSLPQTPTYPSPPNTIYGQELLLTLRARGPTSLSFR